jgi:hypothetical protein
MRRFESIFLARRHAGEGVKLAEWGRLLFGRRGVISGGRKHGQGGCLHLINTGGEIYVLSWANAAAEARTVRPSAHESSCINTGNFGQDQYQKVLKFSQTPLFDAH